jgi:hypothetical protein
MGGVIVGHDEEDVRAGIGARSECKHRCKHHIHASYSNSTQSDGQANSAASGRKTEA